MSRIAHRRPRRALPHVATLAKATGRLRGSVPGAQPARRTTVFTPEGGR
jgi:hypothetical protein